MGTVITFKPKPSPSMPAWRRDLLAQWANPANWETEGDDVVRFFSNQLFVNFYRDEDYGYWGYRAFDGPAYAEDAQWLWCFWDYAEEAALKQLIKIIEGRDKRAKRKRKAKR
jgi:hypothetical protein